MTMLERVASAIYHGTPRNKPYERLDPAHRRYWQKRAIAAIKAMREPTDEMLKAGALASSDWESNVEEAWKEMIRVILSTQPQEER